MKIYKVIILGVILIAITSCHSIAPTPKNEVDSESDLVQSNTTTEIYQQETESSNGSNESINQEGDHYLIYTGSTSYVPYGCYYQVFNDDGDMIDFGIHDGKGKISFEDHEDLLVLKYGLGLEGWQERYYDVTNSRVSSFFYSPIAISSENEFVAYFRVDNSGKITLTIQNMFDSSAFYREFERDFSTLVITGNCTAKFIDDTKLEVEYWSNSSDQLVSEIFDFCK